MQKKILLTILLNILFCNLLISQDTAVNKKTPLHFRITKETIVTDSLGQILPYDIWNDLVSTGDYTIRPKDLSNVNSSFILHRYTKEAKEKRAAAVEMMAKPKESKFFTTGETFTKIKATDLYGNKINTKKLKGKIIVLNYWFTNCKPCVKEMPELNKIVDNYKNDSSVVFIAIALDNATTIESFLKKHQFKYSIIDDGKFLASVSNITSYPTNVVVDQAGKVYFHTSGLAPNTALWIGRSIEELKNTIRN